MPEGSILKVTSLKNTNKVYLSLDFDSNSLRCNLYDTETGSRVVQTVKFLEFRKFMKSNPAENQWIHVSCSIDGNSTSQFEVGKNHLMGVIYSQGETFDYSSREAEGSTKYYSVAEPYRVNETQL